MSPSIDPRTWSAPAWPWEKLAIGVHMCEERTTVVAQLAGRKQWILDGPGTEAYLDVLDAFRAALDRIPVARRSRSTVVVALAPTQVQVKRLFGLPEVRSAEMGAALLRENAPRFFRRTAEELETSLIEDTPDGVPVAAAYDARLVRGIAAACAERGLKLRAIVPADMSRVAEDSSAPGEATDVIASAAAAMAASRAGIRFNALKPAHMPGRLSGAQRKTAGIAAAATILTALAGPLVAARVVATQARNAHNAIRASEVEALGVAVEVARVSEALRALDARASERRSPIELLHELAAALPAGAAVIDLRVDAEGGTVVVLAPSADAVMQELARSRRFTAPEIVGPVTKERHGEREVERVSMRYRLADAIGTGR